MEINDIYIEGDMNVNNTAGKVTFSSVFTDFPFFLGIHNTFLLAHYSKIDKRFPALSRVLKYWGKRVEIIDSYSGYLNRFVFFYLYHPL